MIGLLFRDRFSFIPCHDFQAWLEHEPEDMFRIEDVQHDSL